MPKIEKTNFKNPVSVRKTEISTDLDFYPTPADKRVIDPEKTHITQTTSPYEMSWF